MALTKIDDRGLTTPIDLLDNEKIRFGTGNDLEISHTGSYSLIFDSNNQSDLFIQANERNITLKVSTTEDAIVCKPNSAVELYYDDSKKFETKSTGAQITGQLQFSDNDKVTFGSSDDLQLYHDGTNSHIDNATGALVIDVEGNIQIETNNFYVLANDNENAIRAFANGTVELYYDSGKKFETYADGIKCYNHCRIEGAEGENAVLALYADEADDSNDQFLLVSNGSSLKILGNYDSGWHRYLQVTPNGGVQLYYDAMDGSSPVAKFETTSTGVSIDGHLTVNTGTTDVVADFKSTDANAWIQLRDDHTTDTAVMIGANDDSMMLRAGSNTRMLIAHNGNVGIGTESPKSFANQTSLTIDGSSVGRFDCIAGGGGGGGIYGTATSTKVFANSGATLYLDTAASTDLRLSVNGTDIAKVKSNKDFEIVDGNLVVAAGHGIDFSAQVPSSTGTVASGDEVLDHYEHGTFTPNVHANYGTTDVTQPTTRNGTYTRIGSRVFFGLHIAGSFSYSGSTGHNVTIGNLPFTANGNGVHLASLSVWPYSGFSDADNIIARIKTGHPEAYLQRCNPGASVLVSQCNTSNWNLMLNGSYTV